MAGVVGERTIRDAAVRAHAVPAEARFGIQDVGCAEAAGIEGLVPVPFTQPTPLADG